MATQQKSQFAAIEEEILARWQQEKTFEKSVEQRQGKPYFAFNDGPPFANGLPHFGHSLVTSIKDSVLRYKTMRGYYTPRTNGWDCHGLPVEFAIEKQFGVSGKKQILELGIEKFNTACRESIFLYKADWESFMQRIGRWSDYERYYATVDTDYTESVWWVLQQVHQQGLLYRGFKSMPYCPRCETPLSNFEVNEGYRDNVPDPSLYVLFKLKDEEAYLLAWTTTPWSLPGNAAVAVNPKAKYVYVETEVDGVTKTLILARSRLEVLNNETYTITKEIAGKDLVNKEYLPLFQLDHLTKYKGHENLYRVHLADFVSVEDGSGVLHVAPAFGEDDLTLGQDNGLPTLETVDPSGHIKGGLGFEAIKGVFFKDADNPIIEHLTKEAKVFAAERFTHTYPFCYRCDSPLLYYAISTWFIKVSAIKEQLLQTAQDIDWTPSHIKTGRFGKWLEGARDWAISRNRYWGAPMPIWMNEDDPQDYIVVGSIQELKELAGPKIDVSDLHRPFIDNIEFTKDGKKYKRIEEVVDCWLESGSMPVAQWHYPFENKEKFDQSFPASFVIEGLDQTRLWFYVQHVIATILFNKPAFKHVSVNGIINAADGQKLSKRLKNYPPTDDVFESEGADSWRLYLLSSVPATEAADYMRFDRQGMLDVQRNVLGTLMNSFRFFKLYADVDHWQPGPVLKKPSSSNILDIWILERLQQTINQVTELADQYKLAHAIQEVFALIDEMSNWYIRRSRRRFWKSEDDSDKEVAYATLYYVLVRTQQLLAPWAPFISDKLYRELTTGTNLPASVHLSDWPEEEKVNTELLTDMARARDYINQGLAQRATEGIKVRQPLSKVSIPHIPKAYIPIIADELNVKNVETTATVESVSLDTKLTPELKQEGIVRDLIRHIQNTRKHADLDVDDRIQLVLFSDDKATLKAVESFKDVIAQETLAKKLTIDEKGIETGYSETVKVDSAAVNVSLVKA